MDVVTKYFPDLSKKQLHQFRQLQPIYESWNSRINVISRKDVQHLYLHHVLHSLSIAKVIQFAPGTTVLDIGTGGGFPGIPLAILFPETQFHLTDSIKKKIIVAEAVWKEIGLVNVTTEWNRAENLHGKYHFAVSRAVAELKTLFTWIQKKISKEQINTLPNGLICLKGGDVTAEIAALGAKVNRYAIHDFFEEDFFNEKWILHVEMKNS